MKCTKKQSEIKLKWNEREAFAPSVFSHERTRSVRTPGIFTRPNAKRSQPWYFHAIEREAFGPKNISNLYSFISYIYFISFYQQVVKYLKKAMPSTQWLWIKPTPTTRSYNYIGTSFFSTHMLMSCACYQLSILRSQ